MTSQISIYGFAGAPDLERDARERFQPEEGMVAVVGGATLTQGKLDGIRPSLIFESNGEGCLIVFEDFVDPFPPGYVDMED